MPKQSKTEQTNGSTPEPLTSVPENGATAAPKKRVRSAKTPAKKSAAKKSSGKTAKKSSAPRAKKNKAYEPSDEAIRIRAYFLAERRVQLSLGGDPAQDWLNAKQQLTEEAGARSS